MHTSKRMTIAYLAMAAALLALIALVGVLVAVDFAVGLGY